MIRLTERWPHKGRAEVAVGVGGCAVGRASHVILSEGLGSCVVLVLYDRRRKIGGLAHVMLPGSDSGERPEVPCCNAGTAFELLLERVHGGGADPTDIVAKMAGGASMFRNGDDDEPRERLGEQIVADIERILRRKGVPLIDRDTLGHHGRNVEFHLDSGVLVVEAIGRPDVLI